MNYRLLDRGETMQEGDESLCSTDAEKWEPIPHWSVGMPYRPSNNPVRRLDDLRLDAESVIERLQARIEHSDYFNGVRFARLFLWAHEELNETQKTRYFSIVANGTADPMEPPTHARQLNMMRHRAELAEAALAKLRGNAGVGIPMTGVEFETLLDELGYGRKSYPPNGRLNHWPSGKLFDPVDYQWIKTFAERLLSRRVTPWTAPDDDALPPEPQRVAAGLVEIAKTLPVGSASIVRRAAELLVAPVKVSDSAKCEGFADTSGGGHRPLGDCADCARFSWDCGFPGDGDEWVERPSSQLGCPLKLTLSDSRTKGHSQ